MGVCALGQKTVANLNERLNRMAETQHLIDGLLKQINEDLEGGVFPFASSRRTEAGEPPRIPLAASSHEANQQPPSLDIGAESKVGRNNERLNAATTFFSSNSAAGQGLFSLESPAAPPPPLPRSNMPKGGFGGLPCAANASIRVDRRLTESVGVHW